MENKHGERRRFFRINEAVGISCQVLDGNESLAEASPFDFLSLVSEQDEQIQKLLAELSNEHPKIVELIGHFNQKLERIVGQLVVDSGLVTRIANKVKEVNISACGIAFTSEEPIAVGASLQLELTLFPHKKKILTNGRVVGCDPSDHTKWFHWRVDFYGMSKAHQEELIQHIVRSQAQQLKTTRSL